MTAANARASGVLAASSRAHRLRKEELTSTTYPGTPKNRALPAQVFAATTTKDVVTTDRVSPLGRGATAK